ncbi:sulfatase-like protein [Dyadobacter jejuensis]|uniref:Sulfatase-like protein n=1 Tax=Dyadobacter jejuensis TaxID=1082580 RepID=A0A316B083_9BACT|nr:sulfatase-like hydrolase/transferase [Dyadobacter jejuensis]PWJ55907.1 sulfatase-like protein [Dyadobacter jejuensis]
MIQNHSIITHKLLLLPILLLFIFASCKKQIAINEEEDGTPSNIVLIIADDMGWDAFGAYPGINSSKASRPTLDSLARNGITFTNLWAHPECSPTRAALLTGQYSFRTGVGSKGEDWQTVKRLNKKTSTIKLAAVIAMP